MERYEEIYGNELGKFLLYDLETIKVARNIIHKDYCVNEEWHDKDIEHICGRMKDIIEKYDTKR